MNIYLVVYSAGPYEVLYETCKSREEYLKLIAELKEYEYSILSVVRGKDITPD